MIFREFPSYQSIRGGVPFPKALVVNSYKPQEKKALEHMAHGRVLWLDVMTHEGKRISIINIHQATARRPDLQRRVNTHIQAEMNRSERWRRIMGGDLNAATSRTGYSISTKSHFEKVDSQFQEFIQGWRVVAHRCGGASNQCTVLFGAGISAVSSLEKFYVMTWSSFELLISSSDAPPIRSLRVCASD